MQRAGKNIKVARFNPRHQQSKGARPGKPALVPFVDFLPDSPVDCDKRARFGGHALSGEPPVFVRRFNMKNCSSTCRVVMAICRLPSANSALVVEDHSAVQI